MNKQDLYDYIDTQQESIYELWKNLVSIESQSQNVDGVNQMASHLDTYCSALGLNTRKYIFEHAGASLVAFTRKTEKESVALMAHMDTVHPAGAFGTELFREDGTYVYGPGVYDCKGGIVIALLVMRTLVHAGYDKRQLKLILSGDEEVAHSLSGGKAIEVYTQEVKDCAAAFNCESAPLNGDVVTQRKGGTVVKITVKGVAAHAGAAPEKGASAIREAADKILAIEALTDFTGTTFNCGKISGGTGSNVIADYCEFVVGIRFKNNADCQKAIKQLEEICAVKKDERTTTIMEPQSTFMAMEKTPGTDALFATYADACTELGIDRPNALYAGGCSDAAYVAMEGVPVLCGVGVRGSDNHSPKERALKSSICEQAKKLVTAIVNLDE